MSLLIREINLSEKKELNQFVDLPWKLYKDDPHWVPPLKMAVRDLLNPKHPFYKTSKVKAWIAERKNEPVGRIIAINNHTYNNYHKTKLGFFGFYEAIDDSAVSNLLMSTAENFLKSEGLDAIQGPMNPGTNYECGFLVDKYDDAPQLMMTYNPHFYNLHMKDMGYAKAMDLLAYNFKAPYEMPKIILDIAERTEKKSKVTYRNLNMKKWNEELDAIFEIYNSAWDSNWGFVPMTKEEFYHTAKDLKSLVDPNLVHFAEVDGRPAGFILTLPDLNQVFKTIPHGRLTPVSIYKILTAKKRMNRARVVMMGVKKEYRKFGIETLLYKYNQIEMKKYDHIKNVEMSWILEDNLEMNKPLVRMSGEPYKRYRLYEKSLY